MNRIITMIVRQLVNVGVRKGIDMAARRGQDPNAPVTQETKAREREARTQGKRAKQAMRIARRMGRF